MGNLPVDPINFVRIKTLRDVMPMELCGGEFLDTKAYEFRDVAVVKEHSLLIHDEVYKPWPGKHRNVYYWYELANGYSVAHNENPGRGWSFPVIKTR
jgi:hypothetical protein